MRHGHAGLLQAEEIGLGGAERLNLVWREKTRRLHEHLLVDLFLLLQYLSRLRQPIRRAQKR